MRKAARADIELPRGYLSFSQFRQYLTCAACYERRKLELRNLPGNKLLAAGIRSKQ